jgi:hypothetical protein
VSLYVPRAIRVAQPVDLLERWQAVVKIINLVIPRGHTDKQKYDTRLKELNRGLKIKKILKYIAQSAPIRDVRVVHGPFFIYGARLRLPNPATEVTFGKCHPPNSQNTQIFRRLSQRHTLGNPNFIHQKHNNNITFLSRNVGFLLIMVTISRYPIFFASILRKHVEISPSHTNLSSCDPRLMAAS